MINVVNLTQHYGIRPVLRDLDLHINPGELVAVMGPNGMGKTTLLAAIGGILSPQKGYVEINGRRRRRTMDEEAAIRKEVAYLPADAWLPMMAVRDFIVTVGRVYEVEDERLLDHTGRLLQLFDLEGVQDAPIGSCSTGQQKKVALCSALITDAPVMILDEPFSGGLDPSGILALKRVLQRLAERADVTAVIATPVPEIVEEIAQRIVILVDGRVAACDTPDGLRQQTGCTGSLQEVIEHILNPETLANIEHYFEGERR